MATYQSLLWLSPLRSPSSTALLRTRIRTKDGVVNCPSALACWKKGMPFQEQLIQKKKKKKTRKTTTKTNKPKTGRWFREYTKYIPYNSSLLLKTTEMSVLYMETQWPERGQLVLFCFLLFYWVLLSLPLFQPLFHPNPFQPWTLYRRKG